MPRFRSPPITVPLGGVVTEHLELRKFHETDLDALTVMFAKPAVWWFPYGRGLTRDETELFITSMLDEWSECGFGCWIATEQETDAVVGYVGLSVPMFLPEILPAVEIGWRFDPDHWGRGFASEGARVALREGFTTMGLTEITCVVQVDNSASSRVAERIGMRLDREVVIPATDRRGELQGCLYTMSREEWMACT